MDRISVVVMGRTGGQASYDKKPDKCSICQHHIDPNIITPGNVTGDPRAPDVMLEIAFVCPRYECSRLFVGRYEKTGVEGQGGQEFKLASVMPTHFARPNITAEVKEISGSFEKIYTQAAAAEAYELTEIAGAGYRKALEFLIKDYCIQKKQEDEGVIRTEPLGACIEKRVCEQNIKECAKRAAWLGNDETHYTRRWKDKDIVDLKILIELTMNWITNEMLTGQYMSDMDGSSS